MSRESSYRYEIDYSSYEAQVPSWDTLVSEPVTGTFEALATGAPSLASALDRYQETLRGLTQQKLPGDNDGQTAGLLALRDSPLLLRELRLQASPALMPTLDTLQDITDVSQLATRLSLPESKAAVTALTALVPTTVAGLAAREHQWLERTISASVLELGYELVPWHGPPTAQLTLRARHADETVISVEADARTGRLSIDLDGFTNGACVGARQRLTTALDRRGLGTRLIAETVHCEVGGRLTQRLNGLFGLIERQQTKVADKPAARRTITPPRLKS